MKILNCCLLESKYDSIPDGAWEQEEEYRRFLPYIGQEKNVYDEAGLELTRRNLKKFPDAVSSVLFITKENIKKEYQLLKAHGFSRVLQYFPEENADFKAVFQEAARELGMPDLVVVGQESARWRKGTTGALLADMLRYPYFCNVTDFQLEEKGTVRLTINTEQYVKIETIRLPAVLVIGETPDVKLKTPSRREKLPFFYQQPEKKKAPRVSERKKEIRLRHKKDNRSCRFISVKESKEILKEQNRQEKEI